MGSALTGDAIAMVPQIIELNKKMLSLDGGLMTVAILMRGEQMIDTFSLEFYDQASKRIAFNKVGDWVRRYGADGVVVVSEAWIAFLEETEDLRDPNIQAHNEMGRDHVYGVARFRRNRVHDPLR